MNDKKILGLKRKKSAFTGFRPEWHFYHSWLNTQKTDELLKLRESTTMSLRI